MQNWNIALPPDFVGLQNVPREPRKGRSVFNGYLRGCGLQFGNLKQLCEENPVYQEAMALAGERTIVDPYHLMNIFAILVTAMSDVGPGHIVEFGSYRGGSAIFMAHVARRTLPGTHVYAFDTFEGMPETDTGIDALSPGDFGAVDLDELRAFAASAGLDNLTFAKGLFQETAAPTLKEIGDVSLVHIDCDIRASVSYCYNTVKPFLTKGAYIILDDPLTSSCLGAFEAVEEDMIRRDGLHAEQVFPHMVFRNP